MEQGIKDGKYIYCIIAESEPRTFDVVGIGDRGDQVCTICSGGIAAMVSNAPLKKYRISRDNTMAHEKAIEAAMKESSVLPVRFCTIAKDEEQIKKILETEHGKFKDLLNKMEGKVELALKAVFEESAVYNDILQKHDDIRGFKEKLAAVPAEKAYSQRMEIGKMVESALEEEKELYKKDILEALSPLAADTKTNNTYGELMIVNAAFLVKKTNEAAFDERVNKLSEGFGPKVKFKYVGNLPPFNFVDLVIETGNY